MTVFGWGNSVQDFQTRLSSIKRDQLQLRKDIRDTVAGYQSTIVDLTKRVGELNRMEDMV